MTGKARRLLYFLRVSRNCANPLPDALKAIYQAANASTKLPNFQSFDSRHRIAQRPNPFYCDLHYIARLKRSHTSGWAGQNQVTWEEGHYAGNVADYNIERKDEIARVAALSQLSVHPGFELHPSSGVEIASQFRAHRTERIETLGAGPLPIFILQVARGNVVGAGVGGDKPSHILALAEVAASPGK